ncbi:MAG: formate dehydrogenase subunit gamma [Hyphomicrobiaceae bacterium]
MVTKRACGRVALLAGALALAGWLMVGDGAQAQQQQPNPDVRPPAGAVTTVPPGGAPRIGPDTSEGELWRGVRRGGDEKCTLPDAKACRLVDPSGEVWRTQRMGALPLTDKEGRSEGTPVLGKLLVYGAWAIGGMLALLALFLVTRGRIKVEHGWSPEGRTILRFGTFERAGHWLLAMSFIILAVSGLNLLYGRAFLIPLIGKETFAPIADWGKWLHNYVAFAFMVGLVWIFFTWVLRNLPHWRDLEWIVKGGGLLVKGVHPPAWKFNFGQKIVFWAVVLGGISISLSGLSLMFPYQFPMFAKTFGLLNAWFGLGLTATMTVNEEMQYAHLWHTVVALGLICVVLAHIYIGTIGMQGAFSAMGSGKVDENWAKEHHSLWADRVLKSEATAASPAAKPVPAE